MELWNIDSSLKKKDRDRIIARHGEPPYQSLSFCGEGMIWLKNRRDEEVLFDIKVIEPQAMHG